MAKILWASEQPTRPTGYAVVSREVIKRLIKMGHEVLVMGWDYNGENIKHEEGWTMIHTGLGKFGADKIAEGDPNSASVLDLHLDTYQPDVFISLIDAWLTGHMVMSCNNRGVPHIAYTPIDGVPISYQWSRILGHTHTNLWMSQFGKATWLDFVNKHKSDGDCHPEMIFPDLDRYELNPEIENPVIWHGVDTAVFKPISFSDKQILRDKL